MLLRNYIKELHQIIDKLDKYGFTETIAFNEEIRPQKQLIIKAKAVLNDGSIFIIREYVDARYKLEKLSYAYQYLDSDGNLLFRYDNAVHKPPLGFCDHKHTCDGTIHRVSLPDIAEVVDEIIKYLLR